MIVYEHMKKVIGDANMHYQKEGKQVNICQKYGLWGEYDLSNVENPKVKQNVGSVYGIWISKKSANKNGIDCDENVIDDKWVVVYWGKDITPGSRIKQHKKKTGNTSCLDLIHSKYSNLQIIYGCILVSNYLEFEKYLHYKYPPIEGSSLKGASPRGIEILS